MGWERIGCEWIFTMRSASACALARPPNANGGGAAGGGAVGAGGGLATCAPGCMSEWLGDGVCDRLCNVTACERDHGDCLSAAAAAAAATHAASLAAKDDELSAVESWL